MDVVTLEKKVRLADEMKPVMVVIPALNEAENLAHVLRLMPKKIGCIVVSNPINLGGGAAFRLGYDILKRASGNICVTMDADGQRRPEDFRICSSQS